MEKLPIKKIIFSQSEQYSIDHFLDYKINCSFDDFVCLMVNLNLSGETLEDAHDNIQGYNNSICGFVNVSFETFEDLIKAVCDYCAVYDDLNKFISLEKENYNCYGKEYFDTFEEYVIDALDCDCEVVEYNGKIFKKVYC